MAKSQKDDSKTNICGFFIVLAAWYCRSVFINPLTSDEEFIEQFKTHREDIQSLVDCYRANECTSFMLNRTATTSDEIKNKLLKTGVRRIVGTPDVVGSQLFDSEYERKRQKEVSESLRKDIRENDGEYYHDVKRRFGAVIVELDSGRSGFHAALGYGFDLISKSLYTRPGTPIIKNGEIQWPLNELNMVTGKERIFDSLNGYPSNSWKRGECVFRHIDSEWFIMMCKAYQ